MPAADAGRQGNEDCRHLPLSGANCDRDDHTKVVFAELLARQLEHLLMVLTAESVKGRAVLPMLIQPSMLVASHLAALLWAGSGNLPGTATGYALAATNQLTQDPARILVTVDGPWRRGVPAKLGSG
jgi:hypothetical protein